MDNHNGRADDTRIHIALANDYELVVAGLAAMLEPYRDRVSVDEVLVRGRPVQASNSARIHPIDVVLLDTYGRHELGLDLVATFAPPIARHVVIYTWEGREPMVERAFAAGVSGWLSKSIGAAELVSALERVARGERVVSGVTMRASRSSGWWPGKASSLTERESEVLALLANGLRNAEIAQAMYLSPETVKFHLRHLYRKLGVSSRGEAIAFAHSSEWFRIHGAATAARNAR